MAERFEQLDEKLTAFIARQPLFFVGTAGDETTVNVSPKGLDCLRIIDPKTVVWLNLTGSGNETAAHLLENPRMTIMFCSFDKQPLILRLYGRAKAIHPRDVEWPNLICLFPDYAGARQLYLLDISMVQTSCGYAVPYMEAKGDRATLLNWADKKGADGIKSYWQEKNLLSIDGKGTQIFAEGDSLNAN